MPTRREKNGPLRAAVVVVFVGIATAMAAQSALGPFSVLNVGSHQSGSTAAQPVLRADSLYPPPATPASQAYSATGGANGG